MLARLQFVVATIVAILVALAAGYCVTLYNQNRSTQAELANRAQYLQQSVQLEAVYREIVKGLADLSIRNQDKALSHLLASQGITVNANSSAAQSIPADAKKEAKP